MKYRDFKNIIKPFPIFFSNHIPVITSSPQVLRNQLVKWEKQGLIISLKKGLYVLNKQDRAVTPSLFFIANQLVFPSYVSNEYALGFYDLIPEKTEDITSVTTKKTNCFRNEFGVFRYQHINDRSYTGYQELKDSAGLSYLIATPEKAVVDFLYLNLSRFKEDDKEIFASSYRFQNVGDLDVENLKKYTLLFGVRKLNKVVSNFVDFIKREG